MKILITGAAGFIGSYLVNYFNNKNYTIYGIDNLSRNGSKYNLKKLQKLYLIF